MATSVAIGNLFSPISFPQNWDQISVRGTVWQGKIEIRGARRRYKWDTKNAPGAAGATDTFRGTKPEPFEIIFYLWTDAHFAFWPTFSSLFLYQSLKGEVLPVSIYHPSLAMIGLTVVRTEDVGAVVKVNDELLFSSTVRVHEFAPPPPVNVTTTPTGASHVNPPSLPGFTPSPAVQSAQAALGAARAQAGALGLPGGLPP